MRLAVTALLLFTFACGSKKEPAPADPPKGSAAEPPKGSAEPPKGSASEPPKGSADEPKGSAAADPGPAGSGSAGSADEAKFVFDKLTHDQKMDFMKKQVVPKMKPLFQKFDAKEFANFGCKTCHGKEPAKTKYKMPSKDVPELDFEALKTGDQNPEMAKWMNEVVKPEMAKILNETEASESNPKGFGCLHCHEQAKPAKK
jgi:hypothetical protein